MRIERIDLTAKVGNCLELREPFWIASAHFTTNNASISAWSEFKPAALTLKTCKKNSTIEDKPTVRQRLSPVLRRFGKSTYNDGPKNKEFLTYAAAKDLLGYAREKLPDTKVGISVLAAPDEDYVELRRVCEGAAFCELNLKYAFRVPKAAPSTEWVKAVAENFASIEKEVDRFCKAFEGVPVFVKVPREMTWLPNTTECGRLLDRLKAHGKAGLVLANSLKLDLPEFIENGEERHLKGGVICGEHLFDSTIALIQQLRPACEERGIPIVASGGMVDEDHIVLAFRAGASAVQLCTAFDYYQTSYYRTLCSTLRARTHIQGLRSFAEYVPRLQKMGIASVESVTFIHFDRFFSDEAQETLLADVRTSARMDMLVLSGYTVLENWRDAIRARFARNLGLRLFLPNSEGLIYKEIQKSWGVTEGAQLDARKDRLKKVVEKVFGLWAETGAARTAYRKDDKEAKVEIVHYDQCPFQSFYVFDGKVFIAPYPLVWEEKFDSPIYAFYGRTVEYDRITNDLERVYTKSKHTGQVQTPPPAAS